MGTGTLIVFLYASCCLGITIVGIVATVMVAMGRSERRTGRSTIVYRAPTDATGDASDPDTEP